VLIDGLNNLFAFYPLTPVVRLGASILLAMQSHGGRSLASSLSVTIVTLDFCLR